MKRINEQREVEEEISHLLLDVTDSGFCVDYSSDSDTSLFIRIWKPVNKGKYSYENSQNFLWSEIEEDVRRAFSILEETIRFRYEFIYSIEGSFTSSGYDRKFWKEQDLINGLNLQSIKSFAISIAIDL